jgi:YbbR domain-containing protein
MTVVWKRPSEIPVVIEEIVSEDRTAEAKLVGEPPVGYELLGALISPKIIRVSGPRTQVDRASRVMVTVDLQRIVPGVAISMSARAVDSTGAVVRGIALTPPQVNIVADLKPIIASKALPVFVRTRGAPPDKLTLVSVHVDPPMVTAVLPASRVTEVTRVETEVVDMSTARTSFTRRVSLIVPEGVSLLSDSEVTVSVKLVPAPPRPPAATEPPPG